jgi:hypothetical protein
VTQRNKTTIVFFTLCILPLLLFIFFLTTSIVKLFLAGPLFPNDGSMSVISTLLVGAFGFIDGYSLFVNIFLGLSAATALVFSLVLLTRITHSKKKMLVLIFSSIPLIILCFTILSYISLKTLLYDCSKNTGITLPDSACVHFKQTEWHFVGSETTFAVKFTLDKDDLIKFLHSEPFAFEIPMSQIVPNNYHIDNPFLEGISALPFGWNPDVLKNCWGTEFSGDFSCDGKIYIDITNSDEAIIYLWVIYY